MRKKRRVKKSTQPPVPEPLAHSTLKRDLIWLTLAGVLAYASAVPGKFVWLDHAEIEHANYRIVDAQDWGRLWSQTIEQYQGRRSGTPVERGGYWRPIYALSISLDWALWKDCAWCDHVENILWHLAVVVGLYLLGDKVFGSSPEGRQVVFWATLLFAVHPLGVHSVTWISGRKDTMCAAFGIAALVSFGHVAGEGRSGENDWRRTARWLALAAVCLLLSIGSKELGFVVPLMATVLFRPPLSTVQDADHRRQRTARLVGLSVLWICAFAMAGYRVRVIGATGLDAPYPTDSLLRNVAMSADLFWHYVLRILVPYKVTLSDAWPVVQSIGMGDVLAVLGLLAVLVALVYGTYRNWPWVLAVWWFAIWMLPTSGIVPLRHFRAERYLYPASWGVLVAALMLLWPIVSNAFVSHGRRATGILLTAIAVAFAVKTARENTVWWDDMTLFGSSVAQDPRHVEGLIELSRLAMEREDYRENVRLARLALNGLRDPTYVAYGVPFYAHSWLGIGLVHLQQPADALKEFHQALRYMPDSSAAYENMAMAEVAMGEMQSAKEHLARALELDPSSDSVRSNLGFALLHLGEAEACAELLRNHISSLPDDLDNLTNYAAALMLLGRYDEAEGQFARLVREQPADPNHRARLAWCQWKMGKKGDAKRNLELARRQAPDNPIVHRVDALVRETRDDSDAN